MASRILQYNSKNKSNCLPCCTTCKSACQNGNGAYVYLLRACQNGMSDYHFHRVPTIISPTICGEELFFDLRIT